MGHSSPLPLLLLTSLGLLHTRTVFEGDIVMEDSPSQGDQSAPLANPDRLWPDGTVPYKFDVAFTNRNRQKIVKDSMAYMTTKVPCVKFENLEETGRSTPDYILIRDGVGCDSQLGRRGGQQVINLNRKCFTDGMQTPVHELMHTIGFLHEMNRPDRDEFIEIHPENIQPNQENNFQKRNRSSSKYFDPNYDNKTVDTQNIFFFLLFPEPLSFGRFGLFSKAKMKFLGSQILVKNAKKTRFFQTNQFSILVNL